jgi:hypothetical protein
MACRARARHLRKSAKLEIAFAPANTSFFGNAGCRQSTSKYQSPQWVAISSQKRQLTGGTMSQMAGSA